MGHFDKNPPTQVEDLANKVTEQVSKGHLDGAYAMMKTELYKDFSTMPLEEKRQTWNAVSKILEDNGTLPKLAAVWLEQDNSKINPSDVVVTQAQLDARAKNALDPFIAGFAGEMAKQFNVASKLNLDDGKIDAAEVAGFKARQTQSSADKFADDVVKLVEKDLAAPAMKPEAYEKNPESSPNAKAYSDLFSKVYDRKKSETPEEEAATWKLIDSKLHANGSIPKLSMGWLDTVFTNKSVDLPLMQANMKSTNAIAKEMSGFIVSEFPKIGTVDYHLNDISLKEREIYTFKLGDNK